MELPPFPDHSSLEQRLRDVVADIELNGPTIHWKFEVQSTPHFPFRAYASAIRGSGPDADEELVVALDCYRPGGPDGPLLELQADISKQDGTVLSESGKYQVSLTLPVEQTSRRLRRVIRALDQWLALQVPLIEKILSNPDEAGLASRLEALGRLGAHALRLSQELSGKKRPTSAELLRRARRQGARAA